ncbi:malonic semialdehyde reductase [Caulobacter sp. CCUG 60055]|uniref:malonic semialdehyde reductase n=1 Tax=Caulobacter sp. CCUG 60055 TaxID=2100090 RepID=UPI001FA6F25D|nr:malonic semialdehyde reductase [Caulobacter sp. CCUG 60055]MBQ1543462.1 malonic semialdehyde reductase [Caulobacteraceae bacterium]MCI3179643.1 malonic semialdehyde reductase [Caulobacter sp. CCUG 60055]
MSATPLDDRALDQLFREARTRNGWRTEPLPEALLRQVYDLARMGPTSANISPARFVFVTSDEGRARLAGLASEGNAPKIVEAPCTVIVGYDLDFADHVPKLFPHNPGAKDWFPKGAASTEQAAFRNGSLQGAYLMLAARSLGLDCGPMSGFDNAGVDAAFFAGTAVKSNFICSIGYGTDKNLFARSPRLAFEEACKIV